MLEFRLVMQPVPRRHRAPRPTKAPSAPLARVLVIHPDARVLAELGDALDAASIHAIRVRRGEDALVHEAVASVSAIVSALEMPRLDGIELLLALRNLPATSHIPIVLVSRNGDGTAASLAHRFGADAVLRAPVAPSMLLETVRRVARLDEAEPACADPGGAAR